MRTDAFLTVDMRWGAIKGIVVMSVALHMQHRFHGPSADYWGLAAAAFASWAGVPGPGEPVLIAAGVLAAKHKLDIGSVLFVGWAGATVGGIAGWLVGMKAGRAVMTRRGPFAGLRAKALERGDAIFKRVPITAILLTPSWIAGIHRVRARLYLPTNALGAATWAGGIGLGAYFIGPTVVDVVDDLGWVTGSILVIVIAGGVVLEVLRRRRRAATQAG